MKKRTATLTLGELPENTISIIMAPDRCMITLLGFDEAGDTKSFIVALTHTEAEEIASFINKESIIKSLEG